MNLVIAFEALVLSIAQVYLLYKIAMDKEFRRRILGK